MLLKRKRSTTTHPSPTTPQFSSPPHPRILSATALPSRTQKRHRDNRPEEGVVFQNTLDLLYGAQRDTNIVSSSTSSYMDHEPTHAQPHGKQSSLHAFWNLPASQRVSDVALIAYIPPPDELKHCEDCNTALIRDDDIDAMDIDVDVLGASTDYACIRCGKVVCHGCAVSDLGRDRKCLNCA